LRDSLAAKRSPDADRTDDPYPRIALVSGPIGTMR
jgi:hypothetical protein